MSSAPIRSHAEITRLNLYLALSRTPHLLLDLAAPALAALLCLGAIPPVDVIVLGMVTAFAGYTAVYALNDIIDYGIDCEMIASSSMTDTDADLDSALTRHPLAQGLLSHQGALIWTGSWAALAMAGSYLLNPICPVIFLSAALFEIIYCHLLKITCLRSVVSGVVKTSGPIAAVFAVRPNPSASFIIMLFLWLFFWEIGGQNVPNDLSDLETDRKIKACTIPVQFGIGVSIFVIVFSLTIALAMSLCIILVVPGHTSIPYLVGTLLTGFYFLVIPCYHLQRVKTSREAMDLFNRASYYPLSMLAVTVISWLF